MQPDNANLQLQDHQTLIHMPIFFIKIRKNLYKNHSFKASSVEEFKQNDHALSIMIPLIYAVQ